MVWIALCHTHVPRRLAHFMPEVSFVPCAIESCTQVIHCGCFSQKTCLTFLDPVRITINAGDQCWTTADLRFNQAERRAFRKRGQNKHLVGCPYFTNIWFKTRDPHFFAKAIMTDQVLNDLTVRTVSKRALTRPQAVDPGLCLEFQTSPRRPVETSCRPTMELCPYPEG